MIDFLVSATLFFFVLFALLPLLCLKFIVLQFVQLLWMRMISLRYPGVEFIKTTTVRTLLDTHRNQGIGAVLLCVKGPVQPDAVRRHLHEVVNRRSKNGNLAFPRLRDALVTKCGTYAWKKGQFELEKNFTVVPGMFKNRPVNEFNIQDYVSDLVTKFLPQNTSPWHVIIIPTTENHHYILLKLHHILLNENLNIADLLPLIPPTRPTSGFYAPNSPLVNVFKKPESIPLLKEKLTEELSNYWNEFLSNHDPLERMELLKNDPTFLQFLSICVITLVSILKEIRRGFRVIKTDFHSRFQFVTHTIRKETKKRRVNVHTFVKSILASLDPRNLVVVYFKIVWTLCMSVVRIPYAIFTEFFAFFHCILRGYCGNPNTFVGIIYTYVPLTFGAFKESLEIIKMIFYAPKNILAHILCQKEYLQTITLSGRKCVAWSEPIKTEDLRKLSKTLRISELELLLAGLSANFSKYLHQVDHHVIPDEIAISMRNINSNYIFATGLNVQPEDACSGILFMNLPIINKNSLGNLVKINENFRGSLEKQHISYYLSILQTRYGLLAKILPTIFLTVYLRYLSRKFAVSITEVSSRYPNVTQKTLWGQEVKSAIYWRPPQANTCISLCLNEYADHIKLGVMCDAQLVPNHTILAHNFSHNIKEFGLN